MKIWIFIFVLLISFPLGSGATECQGEGCAQNQSQSVENTFQYSPNSYYKGGTLIPHDTNYPPMPPIAPGSQGNNIISVEDFLAVRSSFDLSDLGPINGVEIHKNLFAPNNNFLITQRERAVHLTKGDLGKTCFVVLGVVRAVGKPDSDTMDVLSSAIAAVMANGGNAFMVAKEGGESEMRTISFGIGGNYTGADFGGSNHPNIMSGGTGFSKGRAGLDHSPYVVLYIMLIPPPEAPDLGGK